MPALTLILPLLLTSPPGCYLVTSERIQSIPCNFRAAATDSLRYAARDEERERAPPKTQPQLRSGADLRSRPAARTLTSAPAPARPDRR
jgi:hypothetical protein